MPPADLQRPFPLSGRVTAAKPPTKSAALLRSITIAGEIAALFLPAQSVISRSYFGFELLARADSHRA